MRLTTDPNGRRSRKASGLWRIGDDQGGRTRVATVVAAVTILVGGTVSSLLGLPSANAFPDPDDEGTHVSVNLEACRVTAGTTLPIAGQFICPDAMYTSGNLGKSWNELDLVPHRMTTTVGNQTDASTDYKVSAAADGVTNGKVGYDVISQPVVNTAKSHASCTASGGPTTTLGTGADPFGGGTDTVIYQDFTIHQSKGTTCVIDWYKRLALGASQYPGASLQSYMFSAANLSGGKQTIPIPVNQIASQKLDKDMTASQGSDHMWDITKGATPANVSFADTCATGAPLSVQVQVTVTWERLAATPTGPITVSTKVYATNPAARTITANVTDVVYSGATAIHTSPTAVVDVPANTASFLVLEHVTTVPAGTTNLNDIATATYTDKDTGVAVPGQTQATDSAEAQVSASATNQTATITDVETISGAGLEFSTDSFSGATGSFDDGYVAGTRQSTPIGWTSSSQGGNGSVTFNKTIYAVAGTSVTGSLSDTATLNGFDGFEATADADIDITAGATVALTIDKTISTVLGAGDANQTFTFDVTGPGGYASSPTITFGQGEGGSLDTSSVTLTGLAPGTYTVAERDLAPWAHQPPVDQTITLPTCRESVSFNNTFALPQAQVQKVTVPAGAEASWTFDLLRNGLPFASATTTGTGFANFGVDLVEGSYTVVERGQTGYDQTGASAECTFTVNLPADADRTFSCTYTNTRRGSITIAKLTQPAGSLEQFTFTGDLAGTIGHGGTATVSVAPGTYTSTEASTTGWDLSSIVCSDSDSSGVTATGIATFVVAAGEDVTCTFTNRQRGRARVVKTVSGAVPAGTSSFTFQLRQGATPTQDGTVLESGTANAANGGIISFASGVLPGQAYQLCEVTMPGWNTTLGQFVPGNFMPPNGVALNPAVDNSILCTSFTVTAGEVKTFTVDNTPPPGGRALTIGFWKNWSSCSGGKQKPTLDTVLASFPIASGQTTHGVYIGRLYVDTCAEAVSILNKTAVNNGKKLASDPAFNMAAQLLATELNFQAGAAKCPAVITAETQAQALLNQISFVGTGSYKNMSAANQSLANQLGNTLDRYNNNLLC